MPWTMKYKIFFNHTKVFSTYFENIHINLRAKLFKLEKHENDAGTKIIYLIHIKYLLLRQLVNI